MKSSWNDIIKSAHSPNLILAYRNLPTLGMPPSYRLSGVSGTDKILIGESGSETTFKRGRHLLRIQLVCKYPKKEPK